VQDALLDCYADQNTAAVAVQVIIIFLQTLLIACERAAALSFVFYLLFGAFCLLCVDSLLVFGSLPTILVALKMFGALS
jgi:predicted membrane channel-forming protein YqfA (hemolysin III family)